MGNWVLRYSVIRHLDARRDLIKLVVASILASYRPQEISPTGRDDVKEFFKAQGKAAVLQKSLHPSA